MGKYSELVEETNEPKEVTEIVAKTEVPPEFKELSDITQKWTDALRKHDRKEMDKLSKRRKEIESKLQNDSKKNPGWIIN